MARPEPMNASPHHAKMKLALSFSDNIYVAGSDISGKLEMESKAEGTQGFGISLIKVELFAFQELTSRDHSATSTFLHVTRMFQGPGLPPSNAVHPFPLPNSPSLPEGYHPARRGTSVFLFKIPVPSSSPPSISFANGLANVKYLVRATAGVYWKGENRLVVTSKAIDIVDAFEIDFARAEPEGVVVGENGKLWMMGKVVGGVCISGEQACVELQVKNHSSKKNSSLSLSLTRTLLLPDARPGGRASINISDTLTTVSFKGPEYIVPPGIEGVASLVFNVPKDARVVKDARFGIHDSAIGEVDSIFEIRAVLELKLGFGFGSKDIVLAMPVPILHPAALPDLAPPQLPYATPGHMPYTGSSTPPYLNTGTATPPTPPAMPPSPYGHQHPSPPVPYSYTNIAPYMEGGQVFLPPPAPGPYPPSYGYAPVPPPVVMSPTLPSARSGTPLPMPPTRPPINAPSAQKEETLTPMPTAQPKSIIRNGAPTSIPLPPAGMPLTSPHTSAPVGGSFRSSSTPLHSPRPHQSVDYLTVEDNPGGSSGVGSGRGTRGMPRSRSVEELERLAAKIVDEEGQENTEPADARPPSPITPQPRDKLVEDAIMMRRHSVEVGKPSPTTGGGVDSLRNATIAAMPPFPGTARKTSDVNKTLPREPPQSNPDRLVVMANAKPSQPSPPHVQGKAFLNVPLVSESSALLPSKATAKSSGSERLAIPGAAAPHSLKDSQDAMYETQIGERTKKLSRDFLASLSSSLAVPSAPEDEEKSVEELLREQGAYPDQSRDSGLDALERRLMMHVGTRRVPGGTTEHLKGGDAVPDVELEDEYRTPVLGARIPRFAEEEEDELRDGAPNETPGVPILKPKEQRDGDGGGDSAVSSLSLAAPISVPPPPPLGTITLQPTNSIPGEENGNANAHLRTSAESHGSLELDNHREKRSGGKRKMKASNNRVEAWFRSLEEQGGPDPHVEVLGSSKGIESAKRREREKEKQRKEREAGGEHEKEKQRIEREAGEEREEKQPAARSSGFISFAAHAANTAKVTRSIMLNNSPTTPRTEKADGLGLGKVVSSTRVDMHAPGMTFQRIRAAFSDSAEEERKLARAGGLMGIWAGANPTIKKATGGEEGSSASPVTSGEPPKIKHAWDAEAEASTKSPWEEVLKARRAADETWEKGPSYDVKSARGGRGGRVTSVVQLWSTQGQSPTSPTKPVAEKPKPAPTPLIKSPSVPALLSSSTADAVLSSTASLARPLPRGRGVSPLSMTPPSTSSPVVSKSPVPPASKASPLLHISETAASGTTEPPSFSKPKNVGRQPTSSAIGALKSTTQTAGTSDVAFGQMRLRDLIKKYQQQT